VTFWHVITASIPTRATNIIKTWNSLQREINIIIPYTPEEVKLQNINMWYSKPKKNETTQNT
jgi:hypothetical protein